MLVARWCKQCRRSATRHDKHATNYLAFIEFRINCIWLRVPMKLRLSQPSAEASRWVRDRVGAGTCIKMV